MTADYKTIERSAQAIRDVHQGGFPKLAIILGSGLGSFATSIDVDTKIPYQEIPNFPHSTVQGHAGQMLIGNISGVPILCMQGRMHLYEGYSASQLAIPIRTLKLLGVDTLILTNAAGGLLEEHPAGSLMIIDDHINFSGQNPLVGPNHNEFGDRFFDMSDAYDKRLRRQLAQTADEQGIDVFNGVYVQVTGPNFETPAEVRMFRQLGAHAVGMSTVPECLVAVHCGIRVVGLSLISNLAAGVSKNAITHEEVFEEGQRAEGRITQLLVAFVRSVNG